MLKRKSDKVILIGLSLVLVSAANGYNQWHSTVSFPMKTTSEMDASSSLTVTPSNDKHSFNETGLCVCLPSVSEEQYENAPRIKLNVQATNFVQAYIKKNRPDLHDVKKRSPKYFRIFDTVLTRYDLPLELKYLAVVESDLRTTARSKAGALGLWQLMPLTAKDLGLKRSSKADDRTHAYKSTVAAAKYLRDLHRQFDDWLLVLAAYNSGPGPVYSAIKKSGSRNFWKLQKYLPAESRGHVKRYIAVHYYFEGQGSSTTLTKYELQAHIKEVQQFAKSIDQEKAEENLVVANPVVAINK